MSSGLTREVRCARQRLDDGDDDDPVWFTRYGGEEGETFHEARVNGGTGGHGKTYHDDPECQYIAHRSNLREGTREGAKLRWLAPCVMCSLGYTWAEWQDVKENGGEPRAGDA